MRTTSGRRTIWLGITLLAVSVLGSHVMAARIGIDARNGFNADRVLATGSLFERFRLEIELAGHELVPLMSFEASELAGCEALILARPSTGEHTSVAWSGPEMDAIESFVAGGGGLVIHAEGGGWTDLYVENLNELAGRFGVQYGPAMIEPDGLAFPAEAFNGPHPVMTGVDEPIGLDYFRPIVSVDDPAEDLTDPAWADARFIAAFDGTSGGGGTSGGVVFLGDQSLWIDPGEGDDADIERYLGEGGPMDDDNLVLLHNILAYITEPAGVLGDVNGDGRVGWIDLLYVIWNWGPCEADCPADLNGDGFVGLGDLLTVLSNWAK